MEGNVLNQFGDTENAIAAYERAGIIDPSYEFGYIGLGLLFYNQALALQEECKKEKMI